ncbi:MAG: hypothetical protein B0D92_05655 [Spirochaeta sp. LUC14_002_19_P3]|nr:MAG: hypothetical protein B0D92_05655 [Spirochaeta sp. LUC14_002_19_P3]
MEQTSAADQSMNLLSEIETQVIKAASTPDTFTFESATGSVTSTKTTASSDSGIALQAEDTPTETVEIDLTGATSDVEADAPITVKKYSDGSWEVEAEIKFVVEDDAQAEQKVPVKFKKTRCDADGNIASGSLIYLNSDGTEGEAISTEIVTALKKLVDIFAEIDKATKQYVTAQGTTPEMSKAASGTMSRKLKKGAEAEQSYTGTAAADAETAAVAMREAYNRKDIDTWKDTTTQSASVSSPSGFPFQMTLNYDSTSEETRTRTASSDTSEVAFTQTISGTFIINRKTVEFKNFQLTNKHTSKYALDNPDGLPIDEKTSANKFSGSIIIDGIEIKIDGGVMRKLSSILALTGMAGEHKSDEIDEAVLGEAIHNLPHDRRFALDSNMINLIAIKSKIVDTDTKTDNTVVALDTLTEVTITNVTPDGETGTTHLSLDFGDTGMFQGTLALNYSTASSVTTWILNGDILTKVYLDATGDTISNVTFRFKALRFENESITSGSVCYVTGSGETEAEEGEIPSDKLETYRARYWEDLKKLSGNSGT